WLLSLIDRARRLLGAEVYDKLYRSDQRARMSRTPPSRRHRLMELVEGVRQSATALAAGRPELSLAAVELHLALDLLDRWKNHPAWAGLVASLKDPADFRHVLVVLAAASFLQDAGNAVTVQVNNTPGKRAADLRIVVTAKDYLVTEVKTPQALGQQYTPLDKK